LLADRGERPPWLVLDAGHDCAVVDGATLDLSWGGPTLTVDTLVQGVHWDEGFTPADVGYKAVAVSVSDLAATRAAPRWMLLALSLPAAWSSTDREAWVVGLARGLAQASERFGVYLVGGDTTRMPGHGPAVVSITLGGAQQGAPRARSGAKPGDDLWVTGWPGLAGAGWAREAPPAEAIAALRRPEPPLGFALALDVATAGMDLSDGLGADLPRLCRASGVGADLDAGALPVHPALGTSGAPDALSLIIGGGDDYQLLFTAPPAARPEVERLASAHGVAAHRVGRVTAGDEVRLVGADWPEPLFSHFGGAR
jgi:thiamine-monophosphate kinase